MPLPPDSTLSLLAHTHPGESDYSKPKQAMIVRMSAETLDALQSYNGEKPPLDFDFGEIPGIHIGSTFYPMRSLKEDTPHELYLRTSSASKQMAPLKLYANVTGKFTVERELGDKVKDMLREKTSDAAKQRDRRTKFIDAPPKPSQSNPKKRKELPTSSMFRNAIRPSDQAKLNASASSSAKPTRISSPVPPRNKTTNNSTPLRRRLVHCLAVNERSRDQLVKMVAGSDSDTSTRGEVLELLEELAEQTSNTKRGEDPGTKIWRLKTETWKEVRPFEWPKLPEQERVAMARTGRQKLSSLGITSTDPLWAHFVFHSSSNETAATNGTSSGIKAEALPKRGVSSREVKDKKTKPKADPKAEIHMKDESIVAAPRTEGKVKEAEGASQTPNKSITTVRKLPGSGFKAGKSTSQGGQPLEVPKPSPQPPHCKPTDIRPMKDTDTPGPSVPTKLSPSTAPPINKERKRPPTTAPHQIRKIRELDAAGGTDSDRERMSDRSRDIRRGTAGKEQIIQEKRRAEGQETGSLKRKQPVHDGDDSEAVRSKSATQKKRKTEGASSATPPIKGPKTKDLSLPKKLEHVPHRPRTTGELSPLPPTKKDIQTPTKPPTPTRDGKTSQESSSAQPRSRMDSKTNGGTHKSRRRPIYTSSEDEGEIRLPRRNTPSAPLPTPPMNTDHSLVNTQLSIHSRPRAREPQPLPTDHATLRARYSSTYLEYLNAFQKIVTQKGKIDSMLKHGDGSNTESDGDDLMDSEDLKSLSLDYQRLHEELVTIRATFSREESD